MVFNEEQKRIIQNKSTGHTLIKGSAGSGKTTVAVNRIPFLIDNFCHQSNDKVLMIAFNKSLVNYIEHIYSQIKDIDNKKVEFINIDRLGRIKALPKNSNTREAIFYLMELYNDKIKANNWCYFQDIVLYALNYVSNGFIQLGEI